jgi:hypothetical protein
VPSDGEETADATQRGHVIAHDLEDDDERHGHEIWAAVRTLPAGRSCTSAPL